LTLTFNSSHHTREKSINPQNAELTLDFQGYGSGEDSIRGCLKEENSTQAKFLAILVYFRAAVTHARLNHSFCIFALLQHAKVDKRMSSQYNFTLLKLAEKRV
jgi:hypothetical protein